MASGGFVESHQSLGKTYEGKKSCRSQAVRVCEDRLTQTLMPLA
jgi:hypothetical protein